MLPAPRRLIYLSSGSHYHGTASVDRVDWRGERAGSYADSKLFVTTLAAAVARLRPNVFSNSVDPGWVPTRMGGSDAPDDLELGRRLGDVSPELGIVAEEQAGPTVTQRAQPRERIEHQLALVEERG